MRKDLFTIEKDKFLTEIISELNKKYNSSISKCKTLEEKADVTKDFIEKINRISDQTLTFNME